jgi:hypothetical protein
VCPDFINADRLAIANGNDQGITFCSEPGRDSEWSSRFLVLNRSDCPSVCTGYHSAPFLFCPSAHSRRIHSRT